PLRFVFFEQLVAESRSRRIKNNSDVVRLIILDQPLHDVSKQKGDVRGDAAGTSEALRHGRKKSAVNVRHRIHEKQFFRSSRHAPAKPATSASRCPGARFSPQK